MTSSNPLSAADRARQEYERQRRIISNFESGLYELDANELETDIRETQELIDKAEQLLKLKVTALHQAKRLAELERREENMNNIQGDFDGNVVGKWVRLDESGAGVVKYNDKEYFTEPLGFTSLPNGTEVELSHANGKYFSKF